VDGTGSGACSMTLFGIGGDDPSGYVTRESHGSCYKWKLEY
jgi:hypothetical protein